MENSTELKIIGAVMGLWALSTIAFGLLPLISESFVIESTALAAAQIAVGAVLFAGTAGVFLKESYGYTLGMVGLVGVALFDIYNIVEMGESVIPLLVTLLVAYFLHARRELLQ